MSKVIKQMEMDALKATFKDVRDFVFLSSTKLDTTLNNNMRAGLRKKKIRLQMVKNSLTKRVFSEMGMNIKEYWAGTTLIAWGAGSLAELSKELDAIAKKNEKILKVKGAVSEGQEISFKQALAMPTRAEAIGRVVALAMAPAGRLIGQLRAPGANLASQIKTIAEKQPEAAAAEAPATAG